MSELFQAGLTISGIGLGVVFVLLTLMVAIITGMSRLCALIERSIGHPAAAGDGDPDELVGIIGAAIAAYRNRRDA